METIDIYVDGGFPKGRATWGFIVVENDNAIFSDRGVLDGDINEMYQVAGEIKSAEFAINYCKTNNKRARIFYDYKGIYCWVADFFGGKAWKTNNKHTKAYRKFVIDNRQWVDSFVKIKSHTGIRFNEMVDKIVKM